MSGDVRQLQRFPMSGFQVTPLVTTTQHGGSDTKAFHALRNDVFAGRESYSPAAYFWQKPNDTALRNMGGQPLHYDFGIWIMKSSYLQYGGPVTSLLVSISGLNHHFLSLFGCLSTLCIRVWITTTIYFCTVQLQPLYIWTKFDNVDVVTRKNSNMKLFDHYLGGKAKAYHREMKVSQWPTGNGHCPILTIMRNEQSCGLCVV